MPPELKSKEKRCFYCGGLGHPRPRCPHLKDDLAKNPPVDRRHMPKRGTYKSRRQVKREKEMAKVSAAALQQLQLQLPGHFYATPQQAYPLHMGGRPPVTPYPPQLPTRQATPLSPMQPSFTMYQWKGSQHHLHPEVEGARGRKPAGTHSLFTPAGSAENTDGDDAA